MPAELLAPSFEFTYCLLVAPFLKFGLPPLPFAPPGSRFACPLPLILAHFPCLCCFLFFRNDYVGTNLQGNYQGLLKSLDLVASLIWKSILNADKLLISKSEHFDICFSLVLSVSSVSMSIRCLHY